MFQLLAIEDYYLVAGRKVIIAKDPLRCTLVVQWQAATKASNMCNTCQYLNLVETEECQITFCKQCKTFTLAYKSCCASFTPRELQQFKHVLKSLKDRDFQYDFMGEQKAIIKNPMVWVGFCLTREEVSSLLTDISESLTLFDAFHIIYN